MSIETNLAIEYSMGVSGFRLVTDTSLTTGPFVAVTTIAPTTFTSITGNNITGTWSTATIPAGITRSWNKVGIEWRWLSHPYRSSDLAPRPASRG